MWKKKTFTGADIPKVDTLIKWLSANKVNYTAHARKHEVNNEDILIISWIG